MRVYVDLLVAVNMALNVWALWGTACLAGLKLNVTRLLAAAAVGALYALGMLTPWSKFFVHGLSKLFLAILMIQMAFCPRHWSQLLHLLAIFLLICFATAGFVLGLYTFLLDRRVMGDSLTLGELPSWVLGLAMLLLATTGWRMLTRLENRLVHVANEAQLRVCIGEQAFQLTALVDSGNQLMDLLSGRPIVVASLSAIQHLLPEIIVDSAQIASTGGAKLEELAANDWAQRVHFVPFRTANSTSIMLGIRTDRLEITCLGQVRQTKGVVLALSPQQLSTNNSYQALLPVRLLP